MEHIPSAYRQRCDFCQRELDTREAGVHRYVSGWVKNREGGGGHGISLPKREPRWAHSWCVDREVRGLTRQAALL